MIQNLFIPVNNGAGNLAQFQERFSAILDRYCVRMCRHDAAPWLPPANGRTTGAVHRGWNPLTLAPLQARRGLGADAGRTRGSLPVAATSSLSIQRASAAAALPVAQAASAIAPRMA
jgi:hypothetical protein